MLRVAVLGELLIERDGEEVTLPASWRARSLLGWLALHPGPHARSALAARFWPDILDASARGSLRNALWSLRRAIGEDAVTADRERLMLAPEIEVDAAEFERSLEVDDAKSALALCRGPLLQGLDDDWILEARDRHRERVDGVLEGLAEHASADGDAAAALELRRRRVALDPFGEDAHRALMRHLDATGDRAGALGLYRRFTQRLRTELGTGPSSATRALAAELREQEPAAAPEPEATAASETAAVPRAAFPSRLAADPTVPFAGRVQELRRLREMWTDTAGPPLVLVTGEPGIGKSRLVRELAQAVYSDGGVAVHGLAHAESLVPFEPWAEMLGDDLVGAAGHEVPAAVSARFAELAASGAVLVVFDDLQYADPASARLLGHLLRSGSSDAPRLVAATYRPADVHPDHPLHAVLAATPHEVIELVGLSPTELADVVGRDSAEDLHARSAGNPFLALALAQDPDQRLPPAARDVLARRFAALPPGTRRLLEAAAVAGHEFELSLLEPLADLTEGDFLDGLDAAISAGLVAELPGGVERCAFTHGLVREALLEDLTAARRRRLHARAADLVTDPARVAQHLCQAAPVVDPGRIATAALAAAELAMAVRAYDEAVEGCTRALAVIADERLDIRRPLMLRRAVAFQALTHLAVDVPRS